MNEASMELIENEKEKEKEKKARKKDVETSTALMTDSIEQSINREANPLEEGPRKLTNTSRKHKKKHKKSSKSDSKESPKCGPKESLLDLPKDDPFNLLASDAAHPIVSKPNVAAQSSLFAVPSARSASSKATGASEQSSERAARPLTSAQLKEDSKPPGKIHATNTPLNTISRNMDQNDATLEMSIGQEKATLMSRYDSSYLTKSSGESTVRQKGSSRPAVNEVSFPIHTDSAAFQHKAEEAMRSSTSATIPTQQHRQRPVRVVKPGMAYDRAQTSDDEDDYGSPPASVGDIPEDMLIRYLQSMGTSFNTASDIAKRFSEQQAASGVAAIAGQLPSTMVPPIPPAAGTNTTVAALPAPSTRPPDTTVFSKAPRPRGSREVPTVARQNNQGSSGRGRGARARARRNQHAMFWERSIQPGAVQMQGRAFGAPARPDAPEVTPQDNDEIIEAVDAITIEYVDEEKIVYADSTPLSWKYLLKEKSIRRRILVVFIVLCIASGIIVTLIVTQSPGSARDEATTFPSSTPSSSPTRIDDDTYQYLKSLSKDEDLTTPGTPQHSALGWISTFDDYTDGFNELFDQRYAMVTFFFALGGENWLEKDAWLTPNMHECDWSKTSISCTSDGTGRRLVMKLDLEKNGLVGTIPPEIGLTSMLEILKLSQNQIQGTLPSEVFDLSLLMELHLRDNNVTGSLAANMGTYSNLVFLDLSFNKLKGSIPKGFSNLSLLRTVDLSHNALVGQLPSGMDQLDVISKLNLAWNNLTGPLPEYSVGNLPSFDILDVGHNRLTGTLPLWLPGLVNRQSLIFESNLFNGSMPSIGENPFVMAMSASDFENPRLRVLDFSDNYFTGTIPREIGSFLSAVERIDYSNNRFSGSLPFGAASSDWKHLEEASFQGNLLTGTFPSIIPMLLERLDVSSNLLEGTIPFNLSLPTKLEFLSIANNSRMSGDIGTLLRAAVNVQTLDACNISMSGKLTGADVSKLSKMKTLDVANNRITGVIPTEIGNLKELQTLLLQSNKLSGSIPTEIGSLDGMSILCMDSNVLSGSLPDSLGGLSLLKEFNVANNEKLMGSVPKELCDLESLNMTRDLVGCDLACSCCTDLSNLCTDGGRVSGKSAGIFLRARESGI